MNHLSTYANTLEKSIFSEFLQRQVYFSVIIPSDYDPAFTYPLLLVNDGQDFEMLNLAGKIGELQDLGQIEKFVVAGIHANHDRLTEYGTAIKADYASRGSKAGDTTKFVLQELLPALEQEFHVQKKGIVYAGFSLGGLMALDIAWNNACNFSKVAVFSGALWWREKAIEDGYSDADRIMHAQIRQSVKKPSLEFWFQTGTFDEEDDRDGDGVIDSIQDTLECISELEQKGYNWGTDIIYVEVKEGRHNHYTWSAVLPDFLLWAFGKL